MLSHLIDGASYEIIEKEKYIKNSNSLNTKRLKLIKL